MTSSSVGEYVQACGRVDARERDRCVERVTERITRKFQRGNSVAIREISDNRLADSGCRGCRR
jgi:hypothetical protein